MGCEQSTAPEDTLKARQEGLSAEDFVGEQTERVCLTAEEILGADDRSWLNNWVPTPEWGKGTGVYTQTPTAEDREEFERRRIKRGKSDSMNTEQLRERLMVRFACDENGAALFSNGHTDAIEQLKGKAAQPIGRIGDHLIGLMGWSQSDVEEIAGNSESDQS